MVALREADVVHSLKRHLTDHGLRGARVSDIVVDADGSYRNSPHARALEPMAAVRIGGYRPDLLCIAGTDQGPLVVAFEVKADLSHWRTGVTQARSYRAGVHQSYLALPAEGGENHRRTLESDARESGVGLLFLEGTVWNERLPASDPRPRPWELENTTTALRGLPAVRHLHLNHPLNYLAATVLRATSPEIAPMQALRAGWPGLGQDSTRKQAIQGAQALGLLDSRANLTVEGSVVADLLLGVGFRTEDDIPRRLRLAEVRPAIGAVARSVFLRTPVARLIVETLLDVPGHALSTVELFTRARERNRTLADALFLSDPSRDVTYPPPPETFSSSTPHSLRQCLWHSGVLQRKLHRTAGRGHAVYLPEEDVWELERTLVRRVLGGLEGILPGVP